jgi:hypothetical protein
MKISRTHHIARGRRGQAVLKRNPKNIDVFWYLEELLIKKDLDDADWYHARTNKDDY